MNKDLSVMTLKTFIANAKITHQVVNVTNVLLYVYLFK